MYNNFFIQYFDESSVLVNNIAVHNRFRIKLLQDKSFIIVHCNKENAIVYSWCNLQWNIIGISNKIYEYQAFTRIKLCREPTFIYRRAGLHKKCMRSGADTGTYEGAPRIGEGNNAGVKKSGKSAE